MFTDAYTKIRGCTYFLMGRSKGKDMSCGTAFAIAPGVLATAAHVLHKDRGDSSSFQDSIQVIRDPEIIMRQEVEAARVIAVDVEYDIGLLKIDSPRTKDSVVFTNHIVLPGTEIGAVGYSRRTF